MREFSGDLAQRRNRHSEEDVLAGVFEKSALDLCADGVGELVERLTRSSRLVRGRSSVVIRAAQVVAAVLADELAAVSVQAV